MPPQGYSNQAQAQQQDPSHPYPEEDGGEGDSILEMESIDNDDGFDDEDDDHRNLNGGRGAKSRPFLFRSLRRLNCARPKPAPAMTEGGYDKENYSMNLNSDDNIVPDNENGRSQDVDLKRDASVPRSVTAELQSKEMKRTGSLLPRHDDDNVDEEAMNRRRSARTRAKQGIFYAPSKREVLEDEQDSKDEEGEALEAIATRRAVMQDSWEYYCMICSVLRDRRKYNHVFRQLQHQDAVYPYFNSMIGYHDDTVMNNNNNTGNNPGDAKDKSSPRPVNVRQLHTEASRYYENPYKTVQQPVLPEYEDMSNSQIAKELIQQAKQVQPKLIQILQSLAMELQLKEPPQMGVGPLKTVSAALRKATEKYQGNVLAVTDYCRAMMVLPDLPTLLALLEILRQYMNKWVRRVKLSTLQANQLPKAGGYRDCIVNLGLKYPGTTVEHVCEIQIHLAPLWTLCGVDGYRHYRHCLEYQTDSFDDAYDALAGVPQNTMAELIATAEENVVETPLEDLEWYHERYILYYFAEAGLFLKHGLLAWTEATLRQLIRLRMESPDIGPVHEETILLQQYLVTALQGQQHQHPKKKKEALEIQKRIDLYEEQLKKEENKFKTMNGERMSLTCGNNQDHCCSSSRQQQQGQSTSSADVLWDSFLNASSDVYDLVIDPTRRQREQHEVQRAHARRSRKIWKQIRQERFAFLDTYEYDPPPDATRSSSNSSSSITDNHQQPEEEPNRRSRRRGDV